jgi:intracellular septation protein A
MPAADGRGDLSDAGVPDGGAPALLDNDGRSSSSRGGRLERSAFLHAARPIATDLASTLLFYAVLALTGDARVAAVLGMAMGLCQLAIARWRREPIPPLQWASVGMILLFGGLTLLTRDPRFILIKATIFYLAFGGTMLRAGWMTRYIPPIASGHLPAKLVSGFERGWAVLMLGTGALNLALALLIDLQTAAQVMASWAAGSKIALFAGQYLLFRAVARPRIKAAMNAPAED